MKIRTIQPHPSPNIEHILKQGRVFVGLFFVLILAIGCDVNRYLSKPSPSDPAQDFLLFMLFQREDSNYDLYFYEPNPTPGLGEIREDILRFKIPGTVNDRKKKSIIFVHGWNFKEKNSDPPADFAYKISSIEDTWSSAIQNIDNSTETLKTEYDFYFYTYRTSNYIRDNGRRFLAEIQRTFSDEEEVIIVAHSMGGLVSRQAILYSNSVNTIDGLISLGTPYYGSPFAVKDYKKDQLLFLDELISFYTQTDGGKDLKHTNNFPGQVEIAGGENPYLDELSAVNTIVDSKTIAYYGNLIDCSKSDLEVFKTSCGILKTEPGFSESDAIVVKNSAGLGGNRARETIEKIGFDHSMISFRTIEPSLGLNFFNEVMSKIQSSNWKE